jgi:hypothetical protein
MIFRVMLFLLGILFTSLGLSFIIIYLNLLNMGYNFSEYVHFIISKWETLIIFVGVLLIFMSLYRKGSRK